MPSAPLTVGTSFPCIHETPDRTSVGVVTKVIDGDTIHVLINGTDYKVRYIGINTPEDTTKKERLGPEATARDKQLVAGKTVTLVKDVSETDRFGRLLRFVFVDNVLVNYELVREGYAKATPYKPDTSCEQLFNDAQLQAQQAHLGLWSLGSVS
jgi:micrococcal nuclease